MLRLRNREIRNVGIAGCGMRERDVDLEASTLALVTVRIIFIQSVNRPESICKVATLVPD